MMMKLSVMRLLLWMPLAWLVPALLAQAMGWHPVWGSGSVSLDYLLPLPVAAGVLHLPSFVLCAWGLWQLPRVSAVAAGRLRAAAWGLLLAGTLGLLRLDEVLLAWRSGSTGFGAVWHENPWALFVLTDAALALLAAAGQRRDRWLAGDPVRVALWLMPGLVVLGLAWKMAPPVDAFLLGQMRPGLARGDDQWMVFTTRDLQDAGFAQQALLWAQPWYRAGLGQGGDRAVLFSRSRDAAQRFQTAHAQQTLCLFDDETPPRWLPGAQAQACFDGHQNFSEAMDAAMAKLPTGLEAPMRQVQARLQVCAERAKRAPVALPQGPCAL